MAPKRRAACMFMVHVVFAEIPLLPFRADLDQRMMQLQLLEAHNMNEQQRQEHEMKMAEHARKMQDMKQK